MDYELDANSDINTIVKTTERFREDLRRIFSVDQDCSIGSQADRLNFFESIDERLEYLNTLKKIVTINCDIINQHEDAKDSEEVSDDRRKRPKTNDYSRHKLPLFRNLLYLMALPLHKIADSPTEAKEIVSQIMRAAYKVIENSQTNNLKANKDYHDTIFYVIGCGVEKYGQTLSFCLKVIQILQYKEQLATLLADLVEFIVVRNNQHQLIGEVLREIERVDIRELSKDSSCPRAVSAFLIALSEKCPQDFIPYVNHIFSYLEQDSYLMRNASLSVLGNLHIKYLKDNDEKNIREEVLEALSNHIRDTIGYTRSRALAIWSTICENGCFPLKYVIPITRAAVNRLNDKSCFPRRSAARFLVNILCRNPYFEKLPLKVFMAKYDAEKERYEQLVQDQQVAAETLSQHSTQDGSDTDMDTSQGNASIRTVVVQPEESPVEAQKRKLEFYQSAVEFIKEIHRSIPLMLEMLTSKNVTDIQEAIDFFVVCHDLEIDEASIGFKRMILLVNGSEKSIKDTIIAAYKKIFFDPSFKDSKVISKLLDFIDSASIAEALSLETLIGEFIANGDFTKSMEKELFATYTRVKPNTSVQESVAAIQLIGMLASTKHEIIIQNLEVCVSYGLTFENYSEETCRLARETCIAIRKSLPKKIEDRQKKPLRFAMGDPLFVKLENILVEGLLNMKFEHWYSYCDESLKIIFEMAEHPDTICESAFQRLSDELLRHSVQCTSISSQENTNRNESPEFVFQPSATTVNATGTPQPQDMEMVHPKALARFIHFMGVAALNLAVFLELNVLLEIKIRSAMMNNDVSKNNTDNSAQNISMNNISVSSRRRSKRFGGNRSMEDQNLEEEIGLAGAEAEDMEMEFIGSICDDEIVCGNNLLAKASRIIIQVVSDPIRYYHKELKLASALALAKFMMVSVKFCNNNLRLLFTDLERTTDSEVKINLLVAISDLCVRFPNQLDGWTGKIFECLASSDRLVRLSALRIISRLVLCDVLKAKEQISCIANLIVDEDEQIATQSRHFFLELSKKLNAIYNVLPDIISRLSSQTSEASFRIIMKFILELIDKTHHVDRLIDKLCSRFMETDDERQWCDLAYCLSLLRYSDRSIMRLYEKFDCLKDKLFIDSIRESITSIVVNYKKAPNLKAEIKQVLDEFETKLSTPVEAEAESDANASVSTSANTSVHNGVHNSTNASAKTDIDAGDETETEAEPEAMVVDSGSPSKS